MRPPATLRRLTTHLCVALLLSSFAPALAAQRRRPARTTPRPRPQAQTPARPPRASATPEAATPHAQQQPPPQQRRAEPDLSIEEMLAADSYTVYLEVRRVGTLARAEEMKSAVASLRLLGGAEAKSLVDFYAFLSDNAEALGESRVIIAFLPARADVPQGLLAVELETPAAASAFEPKMRRMLSAQVPQVKKAVEGVAPEPVVVPRPEARGRAAAAKPAAADFALKRAGRWLLAADTPFTLKALRGGEEDAQRLADSARFQSVRARFANDSLFVYVDTNVAQQGWALQMQRASGPPEGDPEQLPGAASTEAGVGLTSIEVQPAQDAPEETQPELTGELGEPQPEMTDEETAELVAAAGGEENVKIEPPAPPTEEEMAVLGMSRVLNGITGGVPRIPGALALGASLDGGALAVRLAVEHTPDGTLTVVPFLPNLVSGPPVTAETASVAPADAELYVAGSLDWGQVYNQTLGAAALSPLMVKHTFPEGDGTWSEKAEKQPTVDEVIASVEKIFGFKFKEDLLPALGNEVAISMPLNTIGLPGPRVADEKKKEGEEEPDAEPGFLYLAALNNPERVREILPRALVAFGFAAPAAPQRAEKRKGFDIHTLGAGDGFSYAIINSFLVAGDLKAVRHCVDSFEARQTLASANAYRDAVAWQAKQKLLHLYLSDAIMKATFEDTRRRSGGSTDPLVRALLAQMEAAETAPASYEATNGGDVVMHELRVPVSLVRSYALAIAVSVKDSPVIVNESMAFYAVQRIVSAEMVYKVERKKGRFATLEELFAEELLEKSFIENMEYKFELEVVGDKFEVSATPKSYGKTGRRSFYGDQTEVVRAADHKGQPATADDPAVEQ